MTKPFSSFSDLFEINLPSKGKQTLSKGTIFLIEVKLCFSFLLIYFFKKKS